MLYRYMQEVQGFLRDRGQKLFNPTDLVAYINRARREVAMRTQCIRRIPPISGSITNIVVTDGGSGYTAPTVSISAPDQPNGEALYPNGAQATATAQQIGGVISNVSLTFGGSGYRQPTATISDPTGTGAELTVTTTPLMTTVANQERYNFADFPIGEFPGVKAVFAVLDCSILYNNLRYTLIRYAFSEYQAYIRNYPFQYSYVPIAYTQLGDGAGGSLLMYPFPSEGYAIEPDCLCLPVDLTSDQDIEAITEPWTDAVPLLAAAYAYQEAQAFNNARFYLDQYREWVNRYTVYARPRMIGSPYGRR